MKKSNKAITIIALIITIIVLLILAGVTINMVLGENGLFNKARTSVGKYENAQAKENTALAGYEQAIDSARDYNSEIALLKSEIGNLKTKVTNLENRATMKSILKSDLNISINSGTPITFNSITIPEDCYAYIYAHYNMTNNDSTAYKGINIYSGNNWICGNGKGGIGGTVALETSCFAELKAGDIITVQAIQYTGNAQSISDSLLRINYFPISAFTED